MSLSSNRWTVWVACWVLGSFLGYGKPKASTEPNAKRTNPIVTSRYQATAANVICSERELSLTALFLPRKVTYEVPLGTPFVVDKLGDGIEQAPGGAVGG